MVRRTVSATSVEMATILFGITIPSIAGLRPRAGQSEFVLLHLSLIVCAVLSAFRVQTTSKQQVSYF
jgi:hypothetical protein